MGLYVEGMLFLGVSLLSGKWQKRKEKQGSWKSDGQSLGTTCCYQGEERRHDGDKQEGTTKTSKEERGI